MMSSNRYDPMNILTEFQKIFNEKLPNTDDDSNVETSHWLPAVDIQEQQSQFLITADLPGVKKEDISVHMENNILSIKGSRLEESSDTQAQYTRTERVKGSFYRRFSLPETADASKITAASNNGVLTITIPKKEEQQPRRIEVFGE